MKKSIKGVLLSGLVYPGVGHWVLGKKGIGLGLMGATSLGVIVIVYEIGRLTKTMIDRIGVAVDGNTQQIQVLSKSSAYSATIGSGLYRAAVWIIAICWVAGIVDAFRIGRRLDRDFDKVQGKDVADFVTDKGKGRFR